LRPEPEQALAWQADLARDGFCVIEGVLAGDELIALRDALYAAARFEREAGWDRGYAYDAGQSSNQRVWNLISRNPLFCPLAEHRQALDVLTATIGWPAMLSSSSANMVNQHGEEEVLHADQTYMPLPWAGPHGINIAWAIDEFTEANGATRVLPGSHLWNRPADPADDLSALRAVEAPAGSMIAIDGRCWHRAGSNRTERTRAGIFNWYTLPIYLPQENWFLSLNPAIRQFGSDTLLTLLGFRPTILGRVNGQESIVAPAKGETR